MLRKMFSIILSLSLLASMSTFASEVSTEQQDTTFTKMLSQYNITVVGTGGSLNGRQIEKLVEDNAEVKYSKYKKGISQKEIFLNYTAAELLELQYYAMNTDENSKADFWSEAAGSTIKVKLVKKNGQTCIFSTFSYGIVENNLAARASESFSSTGRASATITDDVTGDDRSLTLGLTGKFLKNASGSNWTISYSSHSKNDDIDSGIHTVTDSITKPQSVSGTGTFYGDEIMLWRSCQFSYGFNGANITMSVYPKSAFNEADIDVY